MKHVLDAVNDGGPLRAFQDVHNALETEEIGATVLRDRFEKKRQRHRPQWLAAHQGIGINSMMVLVCVGLRAQPRSEVQRSGEGIGRSVTDAWMSGSACWRQSPKCSRVANRPYPEKAWRAGAREDVSLIGQGTRYIEQADGGAAVAAVRR